MTNYSTSLEDLVGSTRTSMDASYFTNSDASSLIFKGLLALLGTYMIVILIIVILQVIANWKIFKKAGEKGWKSIIPIYGQAILYKISGMSPWLVLVYLLLFIPIVNLFAVVAISIMSLYQPINLAKAFNKSTGFTVGMIMVPFIAYLMLGFGNSEYIGFDNNEKIVENKE